MNTTTAFYRPLGRSGIQVSAMGMGCWAIGGPWKFLNGQGGWGVVDDAESIRAIHVGLDNGVNFFDTAANYGAGHSERILGQALAGRHDQAVIATKFGFSVDEAAKQVTNYSDDPVSHIKSECEASLRRLNIDVIDLYQLHIWDFPTEQAGAMVETLESLVGAGKIRAYGWSTDDPERARLFAAGEHCAAVQVEMNVLTENRPMLALCEELNLGALNRGPLAMGVLTGKFTAESILSADDVRGNPNADGFFKAGKPNPAFLKKLDAIREILTSDGRTLAQGALAWLWARSEKTLPIPGFKTVAQVKENAAAMRFGPLNTDQMRQIDTLLER